MPSALGPWALGIYIRQITLLMLRLSNTSFGSMDISDGRYQDFQFDTILSTLSKVSIRYDTTININHMIKSNKVMETTKVKLKR